MAACLQLVGYKIKAILKDGASRCPEEHPLLCCCPGSVAVSPEARPSTLFNEHCFLALGMFSVEEKLGTCHMGQRSSQYIKGHPCQAYTRTLLLDSGWVWDQAPHHPTGSAHCSSPCLVKSVKKQKFSCCCEAGADHSALLTSHC